VDDDLRMNEIGHKAKHAAWWLWHWLLGYIVCYEAHASGGAYCKRRLGHFGRHSTAGGFKWL